MDLLQRARELYADGRMHDALEAAQAACDRSPRDGAAWALLARINRHVGLVAASDDAFERAANLNRRLPVPHRVGQADFARLLAAARDRLSPDARRRLEHTRIEVVGLPGAEQVAAGTDPDAVSLRTRGEPDLLTLFQVNLENRSDGERALAAILERTLARA